jgi:deoxyribodipyrimidine photo-lyase
MGDPLVNLPQFIRQQQISRLITDFDPLQVKRRWQQGVSELTDITVDVVDTHNIVPCYLVSDKEEFAASTFRPKISRLLPEFLDEFPPLIRQRGKHHTHRINWEAIAIALKQTAGYGQLNGLLPVRKEAWQFLESFSTGRSAPMHIRKTIPMKRTFGIITLSAFRTYICATDRTRDNEKPSTQRTHGFPWKS